MELIVLLIRLIAKALDSGGAKSGTISPDAARQIEMDAARQIQLRIEEARLRAARDRRAQDPSATMMARLPPPMQRNPNRLPPQQKQTGRQPTAKRSDGARVAVPKRKSKRATPPPLPGRAARAAPVAPPLLATAARETAPVVRRPAMASADAKLLSRWLRPQTLRAQFILTEVFQPPLSLRDSHLF